MNEHVAEPFRRVLNALVTKPCTHPKAWAVITCEDCGQTVRVEPVKPDEEAR